MSRTPLYAAVTGPLVYTVFSSDGRPRSCQLQLPAGLVHIRQMQTFRDINIWAHMNTVGESGTAICEVQLGWSSVALEIQAWPLPASS